MRLGVDYYPEHWPEERWATDVKLMREAGLSVVRLAEFSWTKMEPQEGVYDFEWLERAVELLGRNGMSVVLGTPTAAPPAWLLERYPDIRPMDEQGRRHNFGTRIHRCMSNPNMRAASRAITQAMVEQFKDNPHVIAWQTDNELGSVPARCYCDSCAEAFRQWLQVKYGDLETLNREWFNYFWSQEVTSWNQVTPPYHVVYPHTAHNPSRLLDYYRFASDVIVNFQREQIEIMRELAPRQQVTHNLMGLYCLDFDHYELAQDLDFISWDNYPSLTHALEHDVMRGIKQQNYWVMEQRSGPCGWQAMSPTTKPGQIRLWSYQSLAHGADTIVYFRWRSCLGGTEQYWHGILNHDGQPRRRYREVAQVGQEFAKLSAAIDGTTVKNEVAIANSYDQIWAYQIQPQTTGGLDYWPIGRKFHEAFTRAGVGLDVVGLHADFNQFKLIVFPSLYLLNEALVRKIEAYVRQGGQVVLLPRTGVKNWNNVAHDTTLPGLLAQCAGIELEEYDAIGKEGKNKITGKDGKEYGVTTWCDVIVPTGAEVLATYAEDFYKDQPAITCNNHGQGKVWYLGTFPEDSFYNDLVQGWIDELKLKHVPGLPENVEAAWRVAEGKEILFLLNLTAEEKEVPLPTVFEDLLDGSEEIKTKPVLKLEPFGVAILQKK